MQATVTGLIALLLYLIGSFCQTRAFLRGEARCRRVLGLGLGASLFHLSALYFLIVTPQGYDLGFFRVASLFGWTMVVLALISSLRRPLENLLIVLFPLAALSLILASVTRSHYPPHDFSAGLASHILVAMLAYSTMAIAAMQALLLAFQNRQLKQHQSLRLVGRLPPLQTMESMLFELLWAGLALLTLVIISGLFYMDDLFAQHLSHKFVLSVIAWCVFAVLLWGRHQLGWRGRTAIRWTLAGFVLLALAYFGSKLVLELILHRS